MDDLFVRDLERKFGDAGYAFWFKTLELIAAHGKDGTLNLSWINYCEKLNKRRDHLRRMLTYCSHAGRLELTENSQEFITITCQKFIEYADNYTKYGGKHQSDFKETTKQEVEVEEEKKKKEIARELLATFEELWNRYPNKQGKKEAQRHFFSSVKSLPDALNCRRALENYLRCQTVADGFIKHGSTWFNDWQTWLNPTDVMMRGAKRDGKIVAHDDASPKQIRCGICTFLGNQKEYNEHKCPDDGRTQLRASLPPINQRESA